jgi:hypothetical protein
MSVYAVDKLIAQARTLAREYRAATGKPLPGVSTEIAEYDAARLLDLELCPTPRPGGYDAIGRGARAGRRIQIKGRAIHDEKKSGQRIGQVKADQDWDSVVLVLLDSDYEPVEIYEADRAAVLGATGEGRDSKRSKRGALSVAKFRHIGERVWSRESTHAGEALDTEASP